MRRLLAALAAVLAIAYASVASGQTYKPADAGAALQASQAIALPSWPEYKTLTNYDALDYSAKLREWSFYRNDVILGIAADKGEDVGTLQSFFDEKYSADRPIQPSGRLEPVSANTSGSPVTWAPYLAVLLSVSIASACLVASNMKKLGLATGWNGMLINGVLWATALLGAGVFYKMLGGVIGAIPAMIVLGASFARGESIKYSRARSMVLWASASLGAFFILAAALFPLLAPPDYR
ncbi:hypothetical protein G3O06_07760 [Burkholderia sp. Ac-20345]|uniref:hypothetical protein n=1 Tax=Burkholderia sp. Ac-20345 TaxID=2703891 RepID=UPI00197BCBC2|nr:hypothetical protein [Burkholderia sp. Ac-20345]MBN3777446.1 hypothetical protein [Burkholderia sp. Ac-20345]